MANAKSPHRSLRGSNKSNWRNPSSSTDTNLAENEPPVISSTVRSSDPSRTIAQLRSTIIAHPQQQCTLTCYIPPSKIGAVIGRKGTAILQIQKEAVKKSFGHTGQVRVSVLNGTSNSNENADVDPVSKVGNDADNTHPTNGEGHLSAAGKSDDSDLWTPVVIRGDPCGVFAAAKLIVPLVSSRTPAASAVAQSENDGNDLNLSSPSVPADGQGDAKMGTTLDYDPSDLDDVVLDVPISRPRHSAIIGRKGMTIAALSADHNVRIMVPHATSTASNINIIQLEGELEHVEQCLASIMLILKGNNSTESSSSLETKVVSKSDASNDTIVTSKENLNEESLNEEKVANIQASLVSLDLKSEGTESAVPETTPSMTVPTESKVVDSEDVEESGFIGSDSSEPDHGEKPTPRDGGNKRRPFAGRGRGRGRGRGGRGRGRSSTKVE